MNVHHVYFQLTLSEEVSGLGQTAAELDTHVLQYEILLADFDASDLQQPWNYCWQGLQMLRRLLVEESTVYVNNLTAHRMVPRAMGRKSSTLAKISRAQKSARAHFRLSQEKSLGGGADRSCVLWHSDDL